MQPIQGLLPAACIEVVEPGYTLSATAGFMVLEKNKQEVARIPLDDVHALIIAAPDAYLSRTLIDRLLVRGAVIVFCGEKYIPVGLAHPYATQYRTAKVTAAQVAISTPLAKRIWRRLIQQKITHQAKVLDVCHRPGSKDLYALAKQVKPGDPTNVEATAARFYWQRLFGSEFRRDRAQPGVNAALNYGYMVVRASVARAVCGAGLVPFFGIFHHSEHNAFQLVDDLLEPWRPAVDLRVYNLVQQQPIETLTPAIKKILVGVLLQDMVSQTGISPMYQAIRAQATSLAQSLLEKKEMLELAELSADLLAPASS